MRTWLLLCSLGAAVAACGDPTSRTAVDPQEAFWAALQDLCGRAFAGTVVADVGGDDSMASQRLVMHVRACSDGEIRIPFHVGDDRSRTWVLTRTADGLRLKHDHRHEDGTEDTITQYGGDTREPGTPGKQEFHADAHTANLLPVAAANIWTVEVIPGRRFAYGLRREQQTRRFRAEFDLGEAISAPPAPWGSP
jgi:hypothetical protein